jgi:hypothetical protein
VPALRQIGRTALAALGALGLMLLSVGHQPVSADGAGVHHDHQHHHASMAAADGPASPIDHEDHGACHACRVAVTALPPAPAFFEPAYRLFTAVAYVRFATALPSADEFTPLHPRAPPAS